MELNRPPDAVDLLVVGAGPIGLACAIEAHRAGLTARVVEKGAIVNSVIGYPAQMEFFSTPELLEIGGHPLATRRYKPLREEAIDYYRGVAFHERLDLRLGERVLAVDGEAGAFTVVTDRGAHAARAVVLATGFFDQANRLGVPGESLPHVTNYYREPYPYSGRDVVVIGAKNSAARAALDVNRHGGRVTLVARGPEVSPSVKYWQRPDLVNRIAEGAITAHFNTTVEQITPTHVHVTTPDGPRALPADAVLSLIGYRPDFAVLHAVGVQTDGPTLAPVVDAETMESTRPGIYLAGTVCGGLHTSRWFIENGRIHAAQIAAHLSGRPAPVAVVHGQP